MRKEFSKIFFCLFAVLSVVGCAMDLKLQALELAKDDSIYVEVTTSQEVVNSLSSFSVDLNFSVEVQDMNESLVTVTGGTLVAGSLTGSGKNYSLSILPSGEGVVEISFPEQNITLVGGSDPKKTKSGSVSVAVDTTSPTVQLTTAVVSPTPLTSLPMTVTFSEAISGLTIGDFSVIGGGASIVSLSGSGAVYQIEVVPTTPGTIYLKLPIGSALDRAGNTSFASNELEIVYNTIPTDSLGVSIAGPTPSVGSINTDLVWTVNYTGAWVVDLNSVTLLGTDKTGCSAVISGSGTSSRTVTISGCSGNGTVGFSIPEGSARDFDGNLSPAKVSGYATISNAAPSITIGTPSPTNGNSGSVFIWNLTYSDATAISLSAADISLVGVSVGCLKSVSGTGLTSRQVSVTGCSGYGPISVQIAAGTATSEAGLGAPAVLSSQTVNLNKTLSANLSASTSTVLKGPSDSTQSFTVQLNAAAAVDVTVGYILTSYTTAVNPGDFTLQSGSIIIPAGQSQGVISYTYHDSTVSGSRIIQPALAKVSAGSFLGSIGANQIERRIVFDANDVSKKLVKVSAGSKHFCGINSLGKLLCAGDNSSGQLGINSLVYQEKPVVVDAGENYIFVSAGSDITCAITDQNVLKCWGINSYGQMGDGTAIGKKLPVVIDPGVQYLWVAVGGYHSCGITVGQILKCWGSNAFGQVGDNTVTKRLMPVEIDNLTSYAQVGVGYEHSCGITSTGVLKCWGRNYRAQLGDGMNVSSSLIPLEIDSGIKYSELAVGSSHNCAITQDSKLKCWGENQDKQIGNNGIGAMTYAPTVIDSGVTYSHVSAGGQHSCGVTSAGGLKCWGANTSMQLGDGTTYTASLPMSIESGVQYAAVSSGGAYNCGITTDGVTKCWGNSYGNGIVNSIVANPLSIDPGSDYTFLSMSGATTCGLLSSNQLKCWGKNESAQFGDGSSINKIYPVEVQGRYKTVAGGNTHACGIDESGTLKCWGDGQYGKLGTGSTSSSKPVVIDSGVLYKDISAGYGHTCGVTSAGVLKCWGYNYYGQVGDGTTADKSLPIVIDSGVTYAKVAAGTFSTCAITTTGTLKCWGYNNYGQIGDGTAIARSAPVPVDSGVLYDDVTIEESHACGLTSAKDLKCWGYNGSGQLGDGSTTNRSTPGLIDSGTKYSSIATGVMHSCGVTENSVLKCWGANSLSQLGDGTTTYRSLPTSIDVGGSYLSVYAQASSTCAITIAKKLKCWGYNADSQLGLGISRGFPSPIDI